MGDPRRAAVFADYIARRWPDRELRIADVAGGKGQVQAELRRRGYRNVVSFDRRKQNARGRPHLRFRWFTVDEAERFDLAVAMHPDAATDVTILWATAHHRPFAVVPCCVIPSAAPFNGTDYHDWIAHLCRLGGAECDALPMSGRNLVVHAVCA